MMFTGEKKEMPQNYLKLIEKINKSIN